MKDIQMVDLKGQYDRIKTEIDHAIQICLNETKFINGPQVRTFQSQLGSYLGVKHVVTCANGTDALQIALMALELKPGDEVIVPCFTYAATAEVIALLQLKPVMVDVNPGDFNISPEALRQAITPATKAVIPVHLFGQCADMEPILEIARQHKLFVVEDAAQAIGATYRFSDGTLHHAGTMGDIGCTSFFPSKNLGAYGDGGALYTNHSDLAARAGMIANHGQTKKYVHDLVGINSRLDTLQAAILSVKLVHLDAYISARREVAAFYDEGLADIPWLHIPQRAAQSTHVFHQYTLRVSGEVNREAFSAYLQEQGVPTMIYYPLPLHEQQAYRTAAQRASGFPVTEQLCREVLSLPVHTEMEAQQLQYIVHAIRAYTA